MVVIVDINVLIAGVILLVLMHSVINVNYLVMLKNALFINMMLKVAEVVMVDMLIVIPILRSLAKKLKKTIA